MTLFESPFLLGFEQFERTLNRIAKSAGDGYPPYNIEQVGDNGIRITIAVAGFTKDDLDVAVEENQLVIRGKHRGEHDDQNRVFLHRGIAARQFQRAFVLADGIEVVGAGLDNGLLSIDLERPTAEQVSRKIEIKAPSKTSNGLGSNALGGFGPRIKVTG
ncbi:MAG: Hsp20 family protein [Alphaproteobacteria bacterium]|nr:Hsp20 family protein [Alphaproteobacteria bacterium]